MNKISKWFSLEEFCSSQVAARVGINMNPGSGVTKNLARLATEVLDPIREKCDCPIIVTSGYRPESLNYMIGGSSRSDHMFGLAADIRASGHGADWLLHQVRELAIGLPIKQCILEFGQWVHVSLDLDPQPRREFLAASLVNGKTAYSRLASV